MPRLRLASTNTATTRARGATIGTFVGILVCGMTGAIAAWAAVTAAGLDGVIGAIVAVVVAMVAAMGLWTLGVVLLRPRGRPG